MKWRERLPEKQPEKDLINELERTREKRPGSNEAAQIPILVEPIGESLPTPKITISKWQVIETIKTHLPQHGLYVYPEIPENKCLNLRKSCRLPDDERLLALVDCTVFGSAKKGLIFGCAGIYYTEYLSEASKLGEGAIPYSSLTSLSLSVPSKNLLHFGSNHYVFVIPTDTCNKVMSILLSFQDLLGGKVVPPCPRCKSTRVVFWEKESGGGQLLGILAGVAVYAITGSELGAKIACQAGTQSRFQTKGHRCVSCGLLWEVENQATSS